MSIPCEYSKKDWESILKLLQRVRGYKKEAVVKLSGFDKREAQKYTRVMGQTGNSIGKIESAIRNISHEIERTQQRDTITISLDLNIYYLIERLRLRKLRLGKIRKQSKSQISPR